MHIHTSTWQSHSYLQVSSILDEQPYLELIQIERSSMENSLGRELKVQVQGWRTELVLLLSGDIFL